MAMRLNRIFSVGFWTPLLTLIYRLWIATMRIRVHNWQVVDAARAQGRLVLFVHWHDELFVLPYVRNVGPHRFAAVVSASRDGAILAGILERLGLSIARGSSSRDGVKALLKVAREMRRRGMIGVVTVDGPRGPRHVAKEGAVFLAVKSEAVIVPVRIYCERVKVFERAWDKFQLPWPGSRCRVVMGEPLELPAGDLGEAALEAGRQRVEAALRETR